MKWRLIPSSYQPATGQMDFDAKLFQNYAPSQPPILRFFRFAQPTLTLGRLEARKLKLENLPFPHEIRPTGGRVVVHGKGDLCYSIIASQSNPLVGGDLMESYGRISEFLAEGLKTLGREVRLSTDKHAGLQGGHCFSAPSYAELTLGGKKVAGGAQARRENIFLQQGVILLTVAPEWESLFPGTQAGLMAGLNDPPDFSKTSQEAVEKAITDAFGKAGAVFEKEFPATVVSESLRIE